MSKSQLKGEITLYSTESEYTGLLYTLRDTIPIMNLLKEIGDNGFNISSNSTEVRCKIFMDSNGFWKCQKYISIGQEQNT